MPRIHIPAELGDAFRYSDARSFGVGEGRLRGTDLDRPFHGIRMRSAAKNGESWGNDEQAAGIRAAALAYALRMAPQAFFSHTTAATLWGIPLPPLDDERIHVSVFPRHRLPRARGVRGHEAQPHLVRAMTHPELGVRISSPASTWATLGSPLANMFDLVAAGDAVVRIPRMPGDFPSTEGAALADVTQLVAVVKAGRRVGVRRLREALPFVRTGSASRPESWARMILVTHGLPEPALNHDVFDDRGEFVACVDLAYPGQKVAIEYEGDHHRTDAATWQRDIRRHDRLAAMGWRVIRVTRDTVFRDPADLVRRVSEALR